MNGWWRRSVLCLGATALLAACGPAQEPPPIPGRPAPVTDPAPRPSSAAAVPVSQPAGLPTATAPAPTPTAGSADGPHISRSVGEAGGLVVFWPRVIPRSEDPAVRKLAGELQQRLVSLARSSLSGRPVDVRPEPERVCPRSGCAAMTAGLLLAHGGGGCTALALVSGPGTADARIVPWAGVVTLKSATVPFREYPEAQVTVNDAVPCDKLLASLAERQADVATALKRVATAK